MHKLAPQRRPPKQFRAFKDHYTGGGGACFHATLLLRHLCEEAGREQGRHRPTRGAAHSGSVPGGVVRVRSTLRDGAVQPDHLHSTARQAAAVGQREGAGNENE